MLVLVPGSDSAARLFEQRLIVIDADAVDAQQTGCDSAKAARQDKPAYPGVFGPEIHSFKEYFAVVSRCSERVRPAPNCSRAARITSSR